MMLLAVCHAAGKRVDLYRSPALYCLLVRHSPGLNTDISEKTLLHIDVFIFYFLHASCMIPPIRDTWQYYECKIQVFCFCQLITTSVSIFLFFRHLSSCGILASRRGSLGLPPPPASCQMVPIRSFMNLSVPLIARRMEYSESRSIGYAHTTVTWKP